MPTAIKLHRMPHIDPTLVYQIVLFAVSAIMLGIVVLLLSSAVIP